MLLQNFKDFHCQEHQFYCRMFFLTISLLSCNDGFIQQNTKQLIKTNNFTDLGRFDTGTHKSRIVNFLAVGELPVPNLPVNFPLSNVLFPFSFLFQGELHKHCADHVEPDSHKEYAAQIQPVKKPFNASQCGWEPFGKA